VLAWARARDTLRIVSDQRGRPTYSPDLADALIRLAGRMGRPDGPRGLLHVAGASVMTRDEQARMVIAGSGARGGPVARIEPVPTRDFPTPAARPLNAELDVTRAAGLWGIRLGAFAPDLEATLDRLIGPRRP
jgi:dTDP-4-dehydrorhamnose reductase